MCFFVEIIFFLTGLMNVIPLFYEFGITISKILTKNFSFLIVKEESS